MAQVNPPHHNVPLHTLCTHQCVGGTSPQTVSLSPNFLRFLIAIETAVQVGAPRRAFADALLTDEILLNASWGGRTTDPLKIAFRKIGSPEQIVEMTIPTCLGQTGSEDAGRVLEGAEANALVALETHCALILNEMRVLVEEKFPGLIAKIDSGEVRFSPPQG